MFIYTPILSTFECLLQFSERVSSRLAADSNLTYCINKHTISKINYFPKLFSKDNAK